MKTYHNISDIGADEITEIPTLILQPNKKENPKISLINNYNKLFNFLRVKLIDHCRFLFFFFVCHPILYDYEINILTNE